MANRRMRHGVVVPAAKAGNLPARVVNVRSRQATQNNKLRLDKLLRSARPVVCIKRRLGGIGDVIMTTPLLKAIKQLIPHCHLIYATDLVYSEGALGDIIRHNPYVDELIPNSEIREANYDYSVDVTTTGLDRERAGKVPPNRIDMFAEEAGVDVSSDPMPIYIIRDEEREKARKELEELSGGNKDIRFVAIQVRSNDARRTWPLERMAELAHSLAEEPNVKVLLFDWGSSVPRWSRTHEDMWLMMDRSFIDTAALVEQCEVVVCPDSSMLHIGGALNKKMVAIFGPIPPESRINHYPNAVPVTKPLLCFPCVIGESNILTASGYKQIQDITTQDYVLTNTGALQRVTKVHKNERAGRNLFELKIFGSNIPIEATGEHKVLTTQRSYSWKKIDWDSCGTNKRRGVPVFSEPKWTKIEDIKESDYCCCPIPETIIPTNKLLKSKDLAWLVGLFIAEGWSNTPAKTSREYAVRLAISNQEKALSDRVQEIIQNHPDVFNSDKHNKGFFRIYPNPKGQSNIIHISNKNFVCLLHELFNKSLKDKINLKNKYIPAELIHAPNEIIKSFLSGLFAGDGYRGIKEDIYSTCKENLALGIQMLFIKLGRFARIYKRYRDTNYKTDTVIYRVHISQEDKWRRWYKTDKHIYIPIKSITKSNRDDQFVWDITVENDPTFTINNVSIFDCWYNPRCIRDEDHKLECLTGITVEKVKTAVMERIKAPLVPPRNIMYGQNMTLKGQDPIILVRRTTNGIGDILMTTPGIDALKARFQDKEVHVACLPEVMPALENNPNISKLIDCHEGINYRRYYMVIDVSSPCASYEAARITTGRPVQKSRVEIFAEAMNIRETITSLKPRYYVSEEEKIWAQDFLAKTTDKSKPSIAVGLRSVELYRNWPEKYYKELFDKLSEHMNIVVLDHSREQLYSNVIDACGFPLRKAIAIMSECEGLITVDTSLLHFSAALDIPTIAIFGPIDYRSRCKGYDKVTVLTADLPCSPCWRNAKMPCKQTGFIREYSKCLDIIKPQKVADLALKKFKGDNA